MKNLLSAALIATLVFGLTQTSTAQKLPKPSPYAEIEQMVGLTEIEIEYSSPAANGRDVWDKLVPVGTLWRAGANECTQISFDQPVSFGGEEIKPGKYALFILPTIDEEWEWILNTDTTLWGTSGYDNGKDVARIKAVRETAFEGAGPERLIYTIENFDNNGGEIVMRWAGVQLRLPFSVATEKLAMKNIERALEETKQKDWRVLRNCASYMVDSKGNLEMALEWIDSAIKLKEDYWYSYWIKAEVLAGLEKYEEARTWGLKAIEMGARQAEEAGNEFVYGEGLKGEMEQWGSK